jgi:hypothetical protein
LPTGSQEAPDFIGVNIDVTKVGHAGTIPSYENIYIYNNYVGDHWYRGCCMGAGHQ